MPVTSGTYSKNETQIYSFLINAGFNVAAASGILANIYKESSFNHTAIGDNGTSYGLCQWHDPDRWTKLKNYCNKNNLSWQTVTGQLNYLLYELKTWYTEVYNTLKRVNNNAQGAYDAAYKWCVDFEKPDDRYNVGMTRGNLAKDTYYTYYSKNGSSESANATINLGQRIVQIAKSCVGLSYIWGGEMYDTNMQGADCSGLVYYCYKEAGIDIGRGTAESYYQRYKDTAQKVSTNNVAAADLLFYENNNNTSDGLDHIAIANGSGGRIHAKGKAYGIVEESGLGNPTYILRILSNSETSQGVLPDAAIGGSSIEGLDPSAYESLTSYDQYAPIMSANLSRVEAEGFDYGYLIDMTHGGEFRFYVPEFSEQAGAQWNDIEIRGRSVNVKSYESTSSRNITVSLDLYAGAGIYKAKSGESGEDTVSRLHKDMYFVKSLEYPDYTNVITRPPAVVHLILGSAINIAGVISNVTVEHLKPLDQYNRAMYVKLSFTVTQTAVNPIDYRDIRNGQYALISTTDIDSLLVGDTKSIVNPTNTPTYSGESSRVSGGGSNVEMLY